MWFNLTFLTNGVLLATLVFAILYLSMPIEDDNKAAKGAKTIILVYVLILILALIV